MKTTHTSGPWQCSPQPETGLDITIRSDNYAPRQYVASITWGSDLFREENIANARLIAAAPDLLEALHKIAFEPFGPADASYRDVINAMTECARNAIAKAEDRQ